MKKLIFLVGMGISLNGFAFEARLLDEDSKKTGFEFAAPVVSSTTSLTGNTQVGQIVFDSGLNQFKGLNSNGAWVDMSSPNLQTVSAKVGFSGTYAATANAVLVFDTTPFDPANVISSGVFTAPSAGKYLIHGVLETSASGNLFMYINGTIDDKLTTVTSTFAQGFSNTVDLAANDTVDLRLDTSMNVLLYSRFVVDRIGN